MIKKRISCLLMTTIVILTMISCIEEADYSLYFSNHTTRESETTWNGWRISVISEITLWFHFESKDYSGNKSFYFTYGNRTDSTTVRNIRPGDSFSIGVSVEANDGSYTVNQSSVTGSTMRYWIDYPEYTDNLLLWTDDMVVKETVSLPRRITGFKSIQISGR